MAQVNVNQRQTGPRPLDLDDAVTAAVDTARSEDGQVVLALHAERLGERDASATEFDWPLTRDSRAAELCKSVL